MITRSLRTIPLALTAGAVLLSGCTGEAAPERPPATTQGAFPVTVENCGRDVTVEAAPERILLVNNDAVGNLQALGAVDRVVAVTSTLQEGLYDDATYEALDGLDALSTETTTTGGSIVSQESILATDADLVIAPENALDRASLESAGIPVYVPTAYCNDPGAELSQTATFDRVWDEVHTLGSLLGLEDRADELVDAARDDLAAAAPPAGTAAALYVSSGGTVLSPYGAPSMVTPIFTAAGLENVYADVDERVFDVNLEDLLNRDPQTIVLLHSSGPESDTLEAFLSSPGVDELAAVQQDRVVVLPFPYTDPPTMLSVQGPAKLGELLSSLP